MNFYKLILSNSSDDNTLIIVLIVLGLVFYFATRIFKTTIRGKIGEIKVSRKLKTIADGVVINNLTFHVNDRKTCQIDHILVCNKGVFVIETKNYIGLIYGDDNSREWVQVLQYGKIKNKLYSPVKQNTTHVYELSTRLGLKNVFNCVVFANDNISHIKSDYVFTRRGIIKYIKSLPKVYSRDDVMSISEKVNSLNEEISNREHVRNIKNMKKDIDLNICPRCGSTLVMRKGIGKKFYGCSNYPKCKFTKKF